MFFFFFLFKSKMALRRTDQIGPSSHQNQYCRGVLCGNWMEERLLDIERAQTKPTPVPLETTYGTSFVNPAITADGASLAPPPLMKAPDAGQHLLLGHNSSSSAAAMNASASNTTKKRNSPLYNDSICTSVNQNYHQQQQSMSSSTAGAASMPMKKVDALQAKRTKWQQERDPDFARNGVPQLAQTTHEPIRAKAPHFVHNFSSDPTHLGLRQ